MALPLGVNFATLMVYFSSCDFFSSSARVSGAARTAAHSASTDRTNGRIGRSPTKREGCGPRRRAAPLIIQTGRAGVQGRRCSLLVGGLDHEVALDVQIDGQLLAVLL